jgi:ACS family hexuronate transporter-like MFS transporter
MDRQTLANVSVRITKEFNLSEEQYGDLEFAFGVAFACGSLFFGMLVDRVSVRWLYPAVLTAWSAMGFVTGLTSSYNSMLVCRALLGFFEAGHWPCALTVTHAVLSRSDRTLGNSILQSGASLGAILTPLVILVILVSESKLPPERDQETASAQSVNDESTANDEQTTVTSGASALTKVALEKSKVHLLKPGIWRLPFLVVGAIGLVWVIAWLVIVKPGALDLSHKETALPLEQPASAMRWFANLLANPRFWALVVMVMSINVTWQLIRAWLPKFLQQGRGYEEHAALYFNSAYYIATDVGCILAGAAVLWMARRGRSTHTARVIVYGACAALTSLTAVASVLPKGWPLLGVLLIVAAGSLGLFPCYYSMTQEVDSRNVGKVTGILGFIAWMAASPMQKLFGRIIDQTGSFDMGLAVIGSVPLAGLLSVLLLWRSPEPDARSAEPLVQTENPQ